MGIPEPERRRQKPQTAQRATDCNKGGTHSGRLGQSPISHQEALCAAIKLPYPTPAQPVAQRVAAINSEAVFQKSDFKQSRCTDHIPQSFPLTGRFRCLTDVGRGNLAGGIGSGPVSQKSALAGRRRWPQNNACTNSSGQRTAAATASAAPTERTTEKAASRRPSNLSIMAKVDTQGT
jgi:hypothetical protein